jgi:hypothetical protein
MIDFPDNPTLDMVFPAAGKTWKWNGTAWIGAIGNNSVTWDNLPGRPVDFLPSAHSHDGISSQDAAATLGIQNNGSLIISDGGIATTLTNTSTEARTIALPNKNGVLATTEDIVNADYATAAQGDLADTALQPEPASYRGVYDNGADYYLNEVVAYNGAYYIRVGEPNPGYPPGGSYWEIFDPSASPAFKLWVEIVTQANWNSASGPSVILNKPTLGTAAATNATDYATAAQGAKADSALQPGAAISSISGLQTALDGKQAAGSYPLSQLAQSSATNGQVPTWNGTAWTPQTPSGGGSGSSVVSNTTGMTSASQLTNIVQITQAGYNAIATPNASTLYIIVG